MPTLHKVVAADNGRKNQRRETISGLHHRSQQRALLEGLIRSYHHLDAENPEELPDEVKNVQLSLVEVIDDTRTSDREWWNLVATRELGNTLARGTVVVDDETLLENVPVGTLIGLEKRLGEWRTFIAKLPILDPAETWDVEDEVRGIWRSQPVKNTRTKKIPRVLVTVQPTEHHPAQTHIWQEDRIIGEYTTIKFSSALHPTRKSELLARVDRLIRAVREAREEANTQQVENQNVADPILDWLLAP